MCKILSFLKRQMLPVGLLCAAAVGLAWPEPGRFMGTLPTQYVAVSIIFFCSGLLLRTDEIQAAFLGVARLRLGDRVDPFRHSRNRSRPRLSGTCRGGLPARTGPVLLHADHPVVRDCPDTAGARQRRPGSVVDRVPPTFWGSSRCRLCSPTFWEQLDRWSFRRSICWSSSA